MGAITTDNPKGAGRNTVLTDDLFAEIKKSIIDGNDLKTTASICEISESTFYTWHSNNYLSLADKIENWKRDRKLVLAGKVIDEMLEMPVNVLKWEGRGEDAEQVVVTDSCLVRIKQDTAKFVLETLDRKNYSKRTELTGEDGKDIMVKFYNQDDRNNNPVATTT